MMKKRWVALLLSMAVLVSSETIVYAAGDEKAMVIDTVSEFGDANNVVCFDRDLAISVGSTVNVSFDNSVFEFAEGTQDVIVDWVIEDSDIATVQGNKVTAVNEGVTSLSAVCTFSHYVEHVSDESGETGEITMELVTETTTITRTLYVTNPMISQTSYEVNCYLFEKKSGFYQTDCSVWIDGIADVSTVTWDCSDDIQIVRNGNEFYINPKKAGVYTITFTADGKILDTCTVDAYNLYFKRNSKTTCDGNGTKWIAGLSTIELYKGESTTITAKGFSEQEEIIWTSSNPDVAKVDSQGKVTAKAFGYTTITAEGGGRSLTYEVAVSYKTAVKAIRYAIKHYFSTYSQPKRMQTNYYDCSSYVWRSYKSLGYDIGNGKTYAPTAASLAYWCVNNHYMIFEGTVDVDKLLPGDLIFWTGAKNGRYKGIYHVDFYTGNRSSITVKRTKYFGPTISNAMVARPCKGSTTGSNVKVKAQDGTAVICWSENYGAYGYQIYRSTKSYGGYKKIATVKKGNSYIDEAVSGGTVYYYRVRPVWKGSSHTYFGKTSESIKCKM